MIGIAESSPTKTGIFSLSVQGQTTSGTYYAFLVG